MENNNYDLLVIGAGASGATIAYEATRRGLKVALLDAGDIGGETSCRSTKLLHGGVRYLELAFKTLDLAQLQLVREALIERSFWLNHAPFLAHRLELALPCENILELSYYRMGLGLYEVLSGERNIGSSRILSSKELNRALPNLQNGSMGGIAYSDGQFNDARLNLLLALTAERAGAVIKTRCKVVAFKKNSKGKICGAVSEDHLGNQEEWNSKVFINAAGNQVDLIRQMAEPSTRQRMLTSRGVHIVLEENLCPKGMGVLLPSTEDGRVLFILPFFGRTQVGTTDTPCQISDAKSASLNEKEYLTRHVKLWFPDIDNPTIKSCWAGGRPLLRPLDNQIKSSRVVREHEIETLPSGLISALGGKWTTCRSIAKDALKAIENSLGESLLPAKYLPIIGSSHNQARTKELLTKQKLQLRESLPNSPLREKQITHLQSSYGLESLEIIMKSSEKQREVLNPIIPICEAEINHSIINEHAKSSTDILSRRCRLAMVDIKEAEKLVSITNKHLSINNLPVEELNLEK